MRKDHVERERENMSAADDMMRAGSLVLYII